MKLDLGSGLHPAEGFEGVDRMPGAQHAVDLVTGIAWPWPDDSIEALRCSHFIEHIPATDVFQTEWPGVLTGSGSAFPSLSSVPGDGDPPGRWVDSLIFFFEQAYRVIVPGGLFEVIWPALKSEAAFQDPTHRRFIPPKQLAYLNREFRASQRLGFLGARCHWVVERCDGVPSRELPDEPEALALAVLTEWDAIGEYRAILRAVKP